MKQNSRSRSLKWGFCVATLVALGCGGHKTLGADADQQMPGKAGSGGTASGGNPGGGNGNAGGPTNELGGADTGTSGSGGSGPTNAGGDGDMSAAGAEGTTDPRYDFRILPSAVAAGPGDAVTVNATSMSDDGNVVAGWLYLNRAPSAFVWTADMGAIELPGWRAENGNLVVAADGSAVFGQPTDVTTGIMRWTKAGGSELLEPAIDVMDLFIPTVSPDGRSAVVTAALGGGMSQNLLWRAGEDDDQFVALPQPAGPHSTVYFNADGSQMLIADEPHVYRWTVAPGPIQLVEIVQPAGYHDCVPALGYDATRGNVSADGSLLVGACGAPRLATTTPGPATFRWKFGDAAMTLITTGPADPRWMTPDGSNLFGEGTYGDHWLDGSVKGLTWWRAQGAVRISENGGVIGLSPDRETAWVNIKEADAGGNSPALWTRTGGVVRLPKLPGAELAPYNTQIWSVSADGTLAVGTCETGGVNGSGNWVHTVMWNLQGEVRDLSVELNMAGFDLKGTPGQELNPLRLLPAHIWSGDSIRIQGTADSYFNQTWIATVPSSP